MPKELIDYFNAGVINSHSTKTHRGTRLEKSFNHNTYDYEYIDEEEINDDKRPLSKKSKYSYDLSNRNRLGFSYKENPDEVKYRKDRYHRLKGIKGVARKLARFHNDYALAKLGAERFGEEMIEWAKLKGKDITSPKVVSNILRNARKILKRWRRKTIIEHPVTGELYIQPKKDIPFFFFMDINGDTGRVPIAKAEMHLEGENDTEEEYMTLDNFSEWASKHQNKRTKQIKRNNRKRKK